MKAKAAIWEWIKAIAVALITVILIRIFFFQAFTIPTTSMEKTLLPGDFILVNKMSYGPRLPNTLLSIPFTHQTIPFTDQTKSYLDWFSLPYFRFPGFSKIKHNDVVVFNFPMEEGIPVDKRTYYVKRCVALPGDTFELKDMQVYINRKRQPGPIHAQFDYIVSTNKNLDWDLLNKLGITEGGRISTRGHYSFFMTKQAADSLRKMEGVEFVKLNSVKKDKLYEYFFPKHSNFTWNIDFYGPLVVPKANDTIPLSLKTLPLYERIIRMHEKNEIEIRNDSIFINNRPASYYVIKMNYYFMLGDNRHNSDDSRFWGLVPENHILGKAVFKILSVNREGDGFFGKIRWSRCFSFIR